jgi:hypothetical protein
LLAKASVSLYLNLYFIWMGEGDTVGPSDSLCEEHSFDEGPEELEDEVTLSVGAPTMNLPCLRKLLRYSLGSKI